MRVAAALVVVASAVVVQVTWVPHLSVAGAYPNLVLVAVLALTAFRGPALALLLAMVGGLLIDAMQPGPVGLHPLALCVAVFGARLVQSRFAPTALVLGAAAAVASALYALTLVESASLLALGVAPSSMPTRVIAVVAALDALLVAALFRPFGALTARFQPEA